MPTYGKRQRIRGVFATMRYTNPHFIYFTLQCRLLEVKVEQRNKRARQTLYWARPGSGCLHTSWLTHPPVDRLLILLMLTDNDKRDIKFVVASRCRSNLPGLDTVPLRVPTCTINPNCLSDSRIIIETIYSHPTRMGGGFSEPYRAMERPELGRRSVETMLRSWSE